MDQHTIINIISIIINIILLLIIIILYYNIRRNSDDILTVKQNIKDLNNKFDRPEVFQPISGYTIPQNDAEQICKEYDATVATADQLINAQYNGANWCSWGWLADSSYPAFPMNNIPLDSTGNPVLGCGKIGVNRYDTPINLSAVNCYGIKPSENNNKDKIRPFNDDKWSEYA